MLKSFFDRPLVRNTAWMLVGQGLRLAIQALYFIEIARSLGATNYGAFIGVVALVGIVFPFGALGSGNLLIKNVARDPSLFAVYWGRALATTAVASSLLLCVVLIASRFVLPRAIPFTLVLLVAGADLFGMNAITVSSQAFQAFERLNWTAAIGAMISAGRFAGAVLLISFHAHPSALQWGYLYFGSSAVVAAAAVTLVWTKLSRPRLGPARSRGEMREGFFFSTGLSAQTIYNDIDKTMLARLSTLDATGIYGAAYRIIDVSFAPVSALLSSAYPNFFRAGSRGVSASFQYAKPLLVRTFGYSTFVFAALLICAGIVPHVLGPEYARTAEAIRWLALIPVFRGVHYFLCDTLSGAGYQAVRAAIQASVAFFNVLINFWLIPAYSWRGAAWSSIASDALLMCAAGVAVYVLARRPQPSIQEAIPSAELIN
jgi:O-antigen/teichoic acid export membrane protein